jgi:hypothetical protein
MGKEVISMKGGDEEILDISGMSLFLSVRF